MKTSRFDIYSHAKGFSNLHFAREKMFSYQNVEIEKAVSNFI